MFVREELRADREAVPRLGNRRPRRLGAPSTPNNPLDLVRENDI